MCLCITFIIGCLDILFLVHWETLHFMFALLNTAEVTQFDYLSLDDVSSKEFTSGVCGSTN